MVNIKSSGQPPWWDSEIREMAKHKNRLRKQAESPNSTEHDRVQFKQYTKTYKEEVMNRKKDFITKVDPCEDENAVINKRFWSHVKNSSSCSRIPDSVYYNGRYRTDTGDKCEIFNTFFNAQFSEASSYNVHIDRLSNPQFCINFSPSDVFKILKKGQPVQSRWPRWNRRICFKAL